MAEQTAISWADATFNPWIGCTKVSPGCDHCYAEGWAKRSGLVQWGPGTDRRRSSEANWRKPIKWNRQAEIQHNAWRAFKDAHHGLTDSQLVEAGFAKPERPRVFCASLADVFDNAVPDAWRMDLFSLIAKTPYLDWLLVTKRVGNVMRMCSSDGLMFDMIEDLNTLPLAARLAKQLLLLARSYGIAEGTEVRIGLQLAQEDLAQLLGASRQRVNQELKALERDGTLRVESTRLVLLSRDKLLAIAQR